MQEKTSDNMLRVNTKLVNCNLDFVTGPFYHERKHINIMETTETQDIEFWRQHWDFLTSEELKS